MQPQSTKDVPEEEISENKKSKDESEDIVTSLRQSALNDKWLRNTILRGLINSETGSRDINDDEEEEEPEKEEECEEEFEDEENEEEIEKKIEEDIEENIFK